MPSAAIVRNLIFKWCHILIRQPSSGPTNITVIIVTFFTVFANNMCLLPNKNHPAVKDAAAFPYGTLIRGRIVALFAGFFYAMLRAEVQCCIFCTNFAV